MKWLREVGRAIGRKLILRFFWGVSKRDSKRIHKQHWRMDG